MNHTVTDSSIALPAAPALQNLVRELYITNFNIVASAAVLFWDILLTFDREVEYIWKYKFSLVTVVFGGIRLLAVGGEIVFLAIGVGIFNVTYSACKGIVWFEAILGLMMSTGSDILLIFRVYALYGRNKLLLRSLCIFEAMAFVAVSCMIMIFVPQIQVILNPFSHQLDIGSCTPASKPSSIIWIPVLCVQTVLFGLAVGRFLYLQWKGPTLIGRLYYTFLRDGLWSFFVLFVVYLLCIIGIEHFVLGLVSSYWCFPLVGICTSRLIINLRSTSDPSHDNYSLDVPALTKPGGYRM